MRSLVNISMGIAAAGLAALALSGCGPSGNKPNVEIIQDMMESPAIKAQEYDETSPHHSGMRVPPENTAPVGFEPYRYATDVEGAAKNLKNPIAGKMDEETLLTGQKYYETNCAVCHGFKGEGAVAANAPAASKMALKPPPMLSDKVKGWPDGHLYHVITMGQGVMGPYASHIPQKYRWQVVNYIRFLEKRDGK
ncbi:c-type cytochrome [Bdellovibrio svalbardensis]|uniref:Cytochrome c n=1 Tax=Bdellovibrio svalbardensis TaxID=2972972 RepID=A0ABT6DKN4_9BACT|nr:cytochrome c [Bdellovibrio svalbardensis]MDG0817424.1 cytochrome c [Bdellovibrio svalbardensis]